MFRLVKKHPATFLFLLATAFGAAPLALVAAGLLPSRPFARHGSRQPRFAEGVCEPPWRRANSKSGRSSCLDTD
jgi:hypothetical protein